jgi:hypothetical protein
MPVVTSVTLNTSTGESGDGASTQPGNARWWDKPLPKRAEDDVVAVHGELVPYVQALRATWSTHDWFDRCHDRIYENRALLALKGAARALSSVGFNPSRMAVATNIVDTFHSRFDRRRPMPRLAVDDADYDTKQQAAEFQAFIRAKLHERNFTGIRSRALKDSCVRGNGIAYVDEGDDDVIVEKVNRWELTVDPHEAAAGIESVRQKHRVRPVAREVLCARYPECKTAIMAAPTASSRSADAGPDEWSSPVGTWTRGGDLVDLYEAWHLPSMPWSEDDDPGDDDCVDDGRFAVCIEGATLAFGRWEEPRFPFAIMRRHLRQEGYWGQGDIERIAEDQHDVNRIARDIQRNVEMDGHLKVFTPAALDNVPTEKLTGRGPIRVRYPGAQPPAYVAPNPVSPAHLSYLEFRINKIYENAGVPQWSAQGRSPLGAGASGVAIDTMEDIYSDRHAAFEAEDARWVCEVAQLVIDACRRMARRFKTEKAGKKKRLMATLLEGGALRRMEWNTVALEEEQYRIDIEPISWVPDSIPGKLARLKELQGLQLWSAVQLLELYDVPDLAASTREVLAPMKLARKVMRDLGNVKKPVPVPEPLWDLELHSQLAVAGYQLALIDNAPEEVAARFRDYADLCQDQIDKAKAAAAPPMGAVPGMPPDPMAAMGAPPEMGGMPPAMPGPMGPPEMPLPPMAA